MTTALEFVAFAAAGTLGFVVDAGVLYLLKANLGLYVARALSFLCAVIVTWLFNRTLTFARRRSSKPLHRELSYYFLFMLGGGAVNYTVYALLVSRIAIMADEPVFAVAAGSLSGMLVNFTLARGYLYRHKA